MTVFKRSGGEVLAGRYIDKAMLIFVLVFALFESFQSSTIDFHRFFKFTLYLGIPCFILIWLIATIGFWKFAYKIKFDEESGEVTFYMYRSKDRTIRIQSINKILMGVAINFHFDGNVVRFHGYDVPGLMEYIDDNEYLVPVEYNRLGEFFSGRKRQDRT